MVAGESPQRRQGLIRGGTAHHRRSLGHLVATQVHAGIIVLVIVSALLGLGVRFPPTLSGVSIARRGR